MASNCKQAPVHKHFAKFCSFCKAKGLPESAFTSHFVKDKPGKGGKVCCPELLKNECGYCHEVGHTPRFCPKLKARDARRKAAAKRAKAQRAKPVPRNANGAAPTKVTNLFEALAGYSTPEKRAEAFPALPSAPKKAPAAPQGVWGKAQSLSIAELEKLLAAKRAAVDPAPFAAEAAAAQAIADAAAPKPDVVIGEPGDIKPSAAPLPVPGNPPPIVVPDANEDAATFVPIPLPKGGDFLADLAEAVGRRLGLGLRRVKRTRSFFNLYIVYLTLIHA